MSEQREFQRRPTKITAIQYDGFNIVAVREAVPAVHWSDTKDSWVVDTLHGEATIKAGDWIATGPQDSWPVDPHYFAKNYEPVTEDLLPEVKGQDSWVEVMTWIIAERDYQMRKFDYADIDEAHIKQGCKPGTWVWDRCIENYMGRASVLGIHTPAGRQAFMKCITALVNMAEAMVRVYGDLPRAGVPSGEIQ